MAMFVGFTPGIAELKEPYLNPKVGKIFKIIAKDVKAKGNEFITLKGKNIVQGFKNAGYVTIGVGSVGWFNPETITSQALVNEFEHYYYPGRYHYLEEQLKIINSVIEKFEDKPLFIFLNIGETHVPYYFKGADWKRENRCEPFGENNDAEICRTRQTKCLEFVDEKLKPLLEKFSEASILLCADHGDCWGEDGLWEHGIHHEKVLTVPLVIRLDSNPV